MSWTDTHRYYEALHRAEDDLNRSGDGRITWHAEYGEIFGSPRRLEAALRSYWNNLVRAQVECAEPQNWRRIMDLNRLAAAHPGLAAAVARAATAAARSDMELAGAA